MRDPEDKKSGGINLDIPQSEEISGDQKRAIATLAVLSGTAALGAAACGDAASGSYENIGQVSQAQWKDALVSPTFGQTGSNLSPFIHWKDAMNGYAVFTSNKAGGFNPWDIYCSKSGDGGNTWSIEVPVDSSALTPGKEVNTTLSNEYSVALHYNAGNYTLYFANDRDGTTDIHQSTNFDAANCKATTDVVKLPVGPTKVNSDSYEEANLTISQGGNGNKLYLSTDASGAVFKIHVADIGVWDKTLVSGISITPAKSSTVWDYMGKTYIGLGVPSASCPALAATGGYDLCQYELTSPSAVNAATKLNFNDILTSITKPNDAKNQDQPMVDSKGILWYTNGTTDGKIARKDPIGTGGDAGIDAAPDAKPDADAGTDATPDAPPGDATTDSPIDAPIDAPTDVPSDVPADVPSDVPADVPTDAPDDAAPDTDAEAGEDGGPDVDSGKPDSDAGDGGASPDGGEDGTGEGGSDGGYECLANVVENKSQCTVTCPGGQIDIKVDGECKVDYQPLDQKNPTKISLKGQDKHLFISGSGEAAAEKGLKWDVDENGGALDVRTVGVLAGPEGTQFGALYRPELNKDGQNNVVTFYTTNGLINLSIKGVPMKFIIEGFNQGQLPEGWEVNVDLKTQSVIGEPIKSGGDLPKVTPEPPADKGCGCTIPGNKANTRGALAATLAGASMAFSLLRRRRVPRVKKQLNKAK